MPASSNTWSKIGAVGLATAVIAGVASGFSGQLTPLGVTLVAIASSIFTSSLSFIFIEHGPWKPATAVMVIAAGGGVWAGTALRSTPEASGVIRMIGGCGPFQVYAQNRWYPYGAATRTAPRITAKQNGNKDPNQSIAVNGWVHGDVAYKGNAPPFNNDIWFHLADGAGWVSFAGVRSAPTERDPTLHADGGPPAPTLPSCEGDPQ